MTLVNPRCLSLHFALMHGQHAVLAWLLEVRADANAPRFSLHNLAPHGAHGRESLGLRLW